MPFAFSIPKTELRSCDFGLRMPLYLMRAKSFGKTISVYLKHHDLMGLVCAPPFNSFLFWHPVHHFVGRALPFPFAFAIAVS